MASREFKYKTNNVSLRKISKMYPYGGNVFANVYFHILDHDYDIDSLDDMLDEYEEKFHNMSKYRDELEKDSSDNNGFDYDKFMEDNDDDYDDYDEESDEEYLDSLYEEYAEAVSEYMSESLYCDMIFGYKFGSSDDFDNFEKVAKETDRSKFRLIIVGVRFSNSIDEKIFDDFKPLIADDNNFVLGWNKIRRLNMDIINNGVKDSTSIISNFSQAIVDIVIKYALEYGDINIGDDVIEFPLENDTTVYMEQFNEFFTVNKFKLQANLNSYDIIEPKLSKLLDEVYGNVITFGNAADIVSNSTNRVEIFKYDNDTKTCLFIKNETGGTYLFLDGYKGK